jgi:hypothetical protein
MPPAITGGKPKKHKKKSSKKKSSKKTTATPKARSLETVKKEAKRLKIPLSKDGKSKTKAQLEAAIRYRK